MPLVDMSAVGEAAGFELPAVIPEGQRDVTIHRYASSLQARGVADDEIVALCLEANERRCSPPMPAWQARKCAESAIASYEKGGASSYGRTARPVARRPVRVVDRRGRPDLLPDLSGLGPLEQARAWLSAMFMPDEVVCLVMEPKSRFPTTEWYAHAGQLCDPCDPLLGRLLGSVRPCGMWAVQNPVREPGGGRRREDVARWRWALVECDTLPADEQLERICALLFDDNPHGYHAHAVTWSGGKSWHAEVLVNARDEEEYRERVEGLYRFCEANGLPPDRSCRNPNRLTRLPGAARGETGQPQSLRWSHA